MDKLRIGRNMKKQFSVLLILIVLFSPQPAALHSRARQKRIRQVRILQFLRLLML